MTKTRICILEPDEIERELISGIVSGEHDVEEFEEGPALLASMSPERPTLVILETNLPGLSGYEICQSIKNDYSHCVTCVVFLSAKTSVDERLKGLESGADDYINKPYDVLEISAKVRSAIELLNAKLELKNQLNYASQTAFQAMSAQSEMGIILKGVQGLIHADSFEKLLQSAFECLAQFGLVSTIYYEKSNEPKFVPSPGRAASNIEQEIIELVRKSQRIWTKGRRCLFTFGDTSLLILNMPEEEEKAGRLRDSLCFLMEAFDVKVDGLNKQMALVDAENWQTTVGEITDILSRTSEKLQDSVNNSQNSIRKMLSDMDFLLPSLGLEDDQEARINRILDDSAEEINKDLEETDKTSAIFAEVMAKLKAMQESE